MFPLDPLLRRFIRLGHLAVADHSGRVHHYGDTAAATDAAIRLHDPRLAWSLARNPAYNIPEAYVNGALTIESGSLLSFIGLILRNTVAFNKTRTARLLYGAQELATWPALLNRIGQAEHNVKHHYDLSGALFELFLDADRQYSCAYYRDVRDDLETAQLAKKQHIAAKLYLQPGQHVLDIGSGWGGLALYIARRYPCVRVTGLTLSDEQLRVSRQRAMESGLAERVSFKLTDYREETGSYDRIVSVGMFEHVGRPNFGVFFDKLSGLLTSSGVALLHTIGFQTPGGAINPWLRRNIFPGAYLPSLAQLAPEIEKQRLWLSDLENLRLHYAQTLAAWHERFQKNRQRAAALYDERFCRIWEFYLQSCEAGFRWGGLTVFQLQLAKAVDTLPITRDYMALEEERLRKADMAQMEVRYAVSLSEDFCEMTKQRVVPAEEPGPTR